MQKPMRDKFLGQFDALTKQGARYVNDQRFKPLGGKGKPLWEFKQFDHRLYCHRIVNGNTVLVVLYSGWVKDKKGKNKEEKREIDKAVDLHREFEKELTGGTS